MKFYSLLPLLALECISFANALVANSVSPRRKETKQEFDQDTAGMMKQGACRAYPEVGRNSLFMCEPVCGDLVKQKVASGHPGDVTCLGSSGPGIPTYYDLDGHKYYIGICKCNIPVVDMLAEDLMIALPAAAQVGCAIIFGALNAVVELGTMAIPGAGPGMNAGMKASIQAAKTIAENGKEASTFLQWITKPCGTGPWVDKINKIFDPLSNVPDSVVPSLGCKKKPCPGRKGAKASRDKKFIKTLDSSLKTSFVTSVTKAPQTTTTIRVQEEETRSVSATSSRYSENINAQPWGCTTELVCHNGKCHCKAKEPLPL
ncbi:hypothetical protein B0J14DRAFT_686437 [Halenospora varia]|nr:hypothetical protein B0J14DRAFT_686437 [Halenospora varia]